MSRVVLAISGGVDSSVAACLLRESGHDVIGVFMRHGQHADAAGARRVAQSLDIPFCELDFQEEFRRIIDYFVCEYTSGRTPNPCIVCNARLKFGKLVDYADSVGAQYVATGHHARLTKTADGRIALRSGRDPAKDQSYVLFGIDRRKLGRLMFPVGEYRKDEVWHIAREHGLSTADKRESQEICFVPDHDHARFVRQHRGELGRGELDRGELDTSGEIVTTDGTVVARHDGLERFTIGQRKGLGIALGQPRYVVRIEPDTRRVVIGTIDELARTELTAAQSNWLIDEPAEPFRCLVKIRYRSRPVGATVEPLPENRFRVRFDEPFHAIAPGQAAVCYAGDRVLGGGWIE